MNVGSCLMMNLQGEAITPKEKELLISNQVAGVILFKRNIKSFKQVHELCRELKSLATWKPFFIGVDREGGRVDRFSHLEEALSYPSAQELSTLSPEKVLSIAQALGEELYVLGIDINFAPVLDLPEKNSDLFKTRTFGNESEKIILTASAFCQGLQSKGVFPCLKHFPGHGNVEEDSHFTLPQDKRALAELESQLHIFKEVLDQTFVSLVMTAHIHFPNIDSKLATFSKKILRDILRDKMNYKGLVVSDDIDMRALDAYSPAERVSASLKGGCNLILSCQSEKTLDDIFTFFKTHPQQEKELAPFIKNSHSALKALKATTPTLPWEEASRVLKSSESKEWIEDLFNKGSQ